MGRQTSIAPLPWCYLFFMLNSLLILARTDLNPYLIDIKRRENLSKEHRKAGQNPLRERLLGGAENSSTKEFLHQEIIGTKLLPFCGG